MFISSDNATAYHNARNTLTEQEVNDKLLDCSDAHTWASPTEKDSLGRCDTWIKADPTFRGLQHALLEYSSRVFVGTVPPKVQKSLKKPQRYIKSIRINKKQGSSLDEKWFDSCIPLNTGLVTVIGNKGSGKSALADIIALGGNSLQQDNFSFLNEYKFRRPRNDKSVHFESTLTWASGENIDFSLSDFPDAEDVERVRYIPQSYLERLCNEFTSEGGGAFDQELRSVIFSHIPVAERLDKSSLDSLLAYLGEETLDRINDLKGDLSKLNRDIAAIESEAAPEYKREIEKKLAARLKELDAHNESRPKEILEPDADPATKAATESLQTEIAKLRVTVDQLELSIKDAQVDRKHSLTLIATADKISQRVENLQASHDDLKRESEADLQDLDLNWDDLVTLNIKKFLIGEKKAAYVVTESNARSRLDPNTQNSDASKLILARQRITDLQNQLDAPTRRHQEYVSALKEWGSSEARMNADLEDAGSIASLRAELTRIANLPSELAALASDRIALCKQIYEKIVELKNHYRRLYKPVQDFILGNQTLAESIQLSFDVRIKERDLQDTLLSWIHLGKAGTYQGTNDGASAMRSLIAKNSFDSAEGLEAFLTELMQSLHEDTRPGSNRPMSTASQLKAKKSPSDFYDMLFGLDYLSPRYALKMDSKELHQLSPGERGLLLLLFYLLVEKSDVPLILDQPEENLDNETVHKVLVPSINLAKQRRQIIIVTHNPNLAVVADSDQVIAARIDKKDLCKAHYISGSLENHEVNRHVVTYLEGTMPAFMNRESKYIH